MSLEQNRTPPARARRGADLRPEVTRVWQATKRRYGGKKVWKQLQRDGHAVGRCTVVRLYHGLGHRGVMRGRWVKTTTPNLALDALEQTLYDRETEAGLVHHSDCGRYLAIRYTDRFAEAGIASSVGSRGDPYDNALAETISGLYKTETIYHLGPWNGLEDVEYATLEWLAWYNGQRLMEPLG